VLARRFAASLSKRACWLPDTPVEAQLSCMLGIGEQLQAASSLRYPASHQCLPRADGSDIGWLGTTT
jgi:hypothetical protein